MVRNQRKQSNRFDDDDDYEYEVADDAEDWSEEGGNFDESETTLQYQYRHKSRGGTPTPLARSVGGRESQERRKKTPPPSWVRPVARKPSSSSRSNRNRHDNRREPHEPYREYSREQERSNHGPHFWDRWRFRKNDRPDEDRSRERPRGTGNPARRPDRPSPTAQSEKNGSGWRRFFLLMFLLACGTAYTFHATMNVPPEGNAGNHSLSENDLSSSTSSYDSEKQQTSERGTTERRTSERPTQRSETRPTGESSRQTTPQESQSGEEHNDDPPGLKTQQWRIFQEQELDLHIASDLTREFHQMGHTAGTVSEESPLDSSLGDRPFSQ